MKISFKTKTLLAALLITIGITSCTKNDIDNTPIYISGVSLIHASPTTEKLDVYIDNTRASVEDFSFGIKMDYLRAYAGDRTISVSKKGLTPKLTTDLVKLEPEIGYSVFVVDRLENIDLLTLTDNLARPATGKAKVRFVNLSPDGGPLNLAVSGVATDLADNKAFKEFSNFEAIDAAERVTFSIKNKTTGLVEATLTDVRVEEGKIYTIYAKGLKADTGTTRFGAAIFTHK